MKFLNFLGKNVAGEAMALEIVSQSFGRGMISVAIPSSYFAFKANIKSEGAAQGEN